eukprot:scaffold371862_cov43-Prasinocladus_malaysianus.AAC.1
MLKRRYEYVYRTLTVLTPIPLRILDTRYVLVILLRARFFAIVVASCSCGLQQRSVVPSYEYRVPDRHRIEDYFILRAPQKTNSSGILVPARRE